MKKRCKELNNKGFSLVELIIVIAILAILAGVISPQLIKYIDSSRKSTDVQNAQVIASAVNIALANEAAYDAAKTAAAAGTQYEVAKLKDTPQDAFEAKVLDILASAVPKPKYDTGTNDDFVIIFDNTGGLSFIIYPSTAGTSQIAANELYPTVGSNYSD